MRLPVRLHHMLWAQQRQATLAFCQLIPVERAVEFCRVGILRPRVGFATSETERRYAEGETDETLYQKLSRTSTEAARRKFTPEFINRIDKIAVFRPLGSEELDRILSIEIGFLQQRIFNSANATPFVFNLTTEARGFLLQEGTDLKYGARHLKRAIERALVHPLSNLIASGQVSGGDVLRVDFDEESAALVFIKEAEDVSAGAMATMIEPPQTLQERAAAYRLAAVSALVLNDAVKVAMIKWRVSNGVANESVDMNPQIAKRAYELYEQRGRQDGRAAEDWGQAEREIRKDEPHK